MPRSNAFNIGQTVTNMATADSGQEFLGWTGDASGTNNPLVVTMDQSKVITARFSKRPRLDIQASNVDGQLLTVAGEFTGVYHILMSTNLADWAQYLTLTNAYGEAQIPNPPSTNQGGFYQAVDLSQALRTATAIPTVVNGFLVAITVTDGGIGYTTAPEVTIIGGGGSGATTGATILEGAVSKIIVRDAGSGYTDTPTVVIAAPSP
jgi:Divergent InlB B-repeat domain